MTPAGTDTLAPTPDESEMTLTPAEIALIEGELLRRVVSMVDEIGETATAAMLMAACEVTRGLIDRALVVDQGEDLRRVGDEPTAEGLAEMVRAVAPGIDAALEVVGQLSTPESSAPDVRPRGESHPEVHETWRRSMRALAARSERLARSRSLPPRPAIEPPVTTRVPRRSARRAPRRVGQPRTAARGSPPSGDSDGDGDGGPGRREGPAQPGALLTDVGPPSPGDVMVVWVPGGRVALSVTEGLAMFSALDARALGGALMRCESIDLESDIGPVRLRRTVGGVALSVIGIRVLSRDGARDLGRAIIKCAESEGPP